MKILPEDTGELQQVVKHLMTWHAVEFLNHDPWPEEAEALHLKLHEIGLPPERDPAVTP